MVRTQPGNHERREEMITMMIWSSGDMGRLQRSFQRPDVFRAVGYVPIPGKRDQLRSYSGRKALVSADGAALC